MVHSGSTTSRRRGFTMMEIMVTVAIIAILVALTVTIGVSVRNSSMEGATKATLQVLQNSMSRFIKDNPEPSGNSADWLRKLTADPKEGPGITGQKWYVAGNPPQALDAWGNPIYYLPSRTAPSTQPLTLATFPKDQGFFYSTGPNGPGSSSGALFSEGVAP